MRQAMRFLALASTFATALVGPGQIPFIAPTDSITASIPRPLFEDLDTVARLVDITYCIAPGAPGVTFPFNCLSRCADFPTFELVTTWHTGLLTTDSAGYIALDHTDGDGKIVVAFRGTSNLPNLVVDLATVPQEYVPYSPGNGSVEEGSGAKCKDCAVHMGFFQAWQDSKDVVMPHVLSLRAVHPGYELVLVGHSMGGAVAAFAGLDMLSRGWEVTVTTFGEPRVGNAAFAKWVDQAFELTNFEDWRRYRRITHVGDHVPLLPLSDWGYTSHAGEIFISKSGTPPAIEDLEFCEGPSDPHCVAGEGSTGGWTRPFAPWQSLFGHRNYFVRMGICVPEF